MGGQGRETAAVERVWGYERLIRRYTRYVLLRSTAYANEREGVGRIAFYALVAACLIAEDVGDEGEAGEVVDMMVEIVGDDRQGRKTGALVFDETGGGAGSRRPVLRDAAAAWNRLGGALREVLVLAHVEGLDAGALGQALGTSGTEAVVLLAEGERAFVELLREMGVWEEAGEPDVHGLLMALAGCLDQAWAEAVGGWALQYLVAWGGLDGGAGLPWRDN